MNGVFRLTFMCAAISFGLAACAHSPIAQNSDLQNTVTVNVENGSGPKIVWATAHMDEGELVLRGRVRHRGRPGFNAIRGHIHAKIRTADDGFVGGADIPLKLRTKPWDTAREAGFFATIPLSVTQMDELTVSVKYH